MTTIAARAATLAFFVLALMPSSQAAVRAGDKPIVEVAFVLDTTGSMSALIEGAKRKIWSIATTIIDENPGAEIRMGLVAYRDIGDEYVTKTFPLTADIQDLYANLLELKARGGGDWPESVNEALHVGVTKLSWTQGGEICRIMFLVGDAPPHMDYAQDTKYQDVLRTARERGILVNAVQAGGARDTERTWREIAQMGQGRYIPIPQDGGHVVMIETPYDAEIIELQNDINGTVIPYGPQRQRSSVEQKVKQAAAAPAPVAAEMAGYMSRNAAQRSGEAITGSGDLVADVKAGRQKLATLKDEDVPEAMRKLTAAQRIAMLDQQMEKRAKLNERMAALVKKRDGYVLEQARKAPKPAADSFDQVVAETLKAQMKR